MFLVVARQLIFTDELENEALVASLLFALHPIHTEAVSFWVNWRLLLWFLANVSVANSGSSSFGKHAFHAAVIWRTRILIIALTMA